MTDATPRPLYYVTDRTVSKRSVETDNGDGTKNCTLGFPVCEVTDWVKDPQAIADMLDFAERHGDSHDQLVAALEEVSLKVPGQDANGYYRYKDWHVWAKKRVRAALDALTAAKEDRS